MFDLDAFLADCRAALAEGEPRLAIRDVLRRAVSDGGSVAEALRPTEGGITLLHHAPDLTVVHVVWAPHMAIYPHDHRMWAAIGLYAGREDNTFYRRTGPGRRFLEESGGKRLDEGDVAVLGDDTVHAVANPGDRLTGAIHIYGGDFVDEPRSQWNPATAEEQPYDIAEAHAVFASANDDWRAATA